MLNRLTSPLRFLWSRPDAASPRRRVPASPRLLARAQARFARSRPGSVLILVVALLVLMALIGTAFMSMAQSDRASSAQHENNTEIDLLLDSMISLVKGAVVSDLYGNGQFRFGTNYSTDLPNTYNNVTGLGYDYSTAKSLFGGALPDSVGTTLISSRLPELPGELLTGGSPSANGFAPLAGTGPLPIWRYVTAPIVGAAFASPVPPLGMNTPFLTGQAALPRNFPPFSYTQRAEDPTTSQQLIPWFINVNGTNMPAWVDQVPNPTRAILAADADGDGIADAGLVKLPMGAVNGITYYVAVRVIDNAAAVNANIAWIHNPMTAAFIGALPPTPAQPLLPGDFFPSNIDFADMLVSTDLTNGLSNVINYRFAAGSPSATPPYPQITAYDDLGNARTDFAFNTPFEAEWMQLGRRIYYPGLVTTTTACQALPLSQSLALAHDFVIRDSSSSSTPLLELPPYLPFSFSAANPAVASNPYKPSGTQYGQTLAQWYDANFAFLALAYGGSATTVPLRSIVTGKNPVGNFAPIKFTDIGVYPTPASGAPPVTPPAGGFQFGDMVSYTDVPLANAINANLPPGKAAQFAFPHRYVCINANQASSTYPGPTVGAQTLGGNQLTAFPFPMNALPSKTTGPTGISAGWDLDNDTWVYEPWNTTPTKTNVNTATFGQLWLAYHQVMADQLIVTVANPNNRTWSPAFPNLSTAPLSPRMFRSPVRYTPPASGPVTAGLTPIQVMQLRSALAAVNTIDMRDADDNVTSRTVHLIDGNNTTAAFRDVVATVYGMERQPFITQVYATDLQYTDSTTLLQHNGFVAIELYNPNPVQIDLSNYTLAYANRPTTSVTTSTGLTFTPIPWAGTKTDIAMPGSAPVIPAFSSVIIASGGTGATGSPDSSLPPNGDPTTGNLQFHGNVTLAPATYTAPTGNTVYLYVVTGLCPQTGSAALGNELYLFRGRLDNPGSPPALGPGPKIASAKLSAYPAAPPSATTQPTSPATSGTLATTFNETSVAPGGANPADMVPVDSYDFSNLYPVTFPTSAGAAHEWYYVRPNPMGDTRKAWHFVYPGHIVMSTTTMTANSDPIPRLLDGTVYSGGPDPTSKVTPAGTIGDGIEMALGHANNVFAAQHPAAGTALPPNELPFGIPVALSAVEGSAATNTYHDIPLELNSPDFGGPHAAFRSSTFGRTSGTSEANGFPFGGFARNGDILEVPYVGAYRLTLPPASSGTPPQIIEMNPPTMDSVMALSQSQAPWGEPVGPGDLTAPAPTAGIGADPIYSADSSMTNNIAIEQVGRFCPIGLADLTGPQVQTLHAPLINDYQLPTGTPPTAPWLYHWATRLFDYLTVQSPQQDMLPDVDPGMADPNAVGGQGWEYPFANAGVTPPPNNGPGPAAPKGVTNVTAGTTNAELSNPNGATEEASPVEGLININTAPWRVMAAVPWMPAASPGGTPSPTRAIDNANIALSIAYYRDVWDGNPGTPGFHPHGPFKSIFELSNVPIYTPIPGSSLNGTPSPTNLLRNILLPLPGKPPTALTADEGDLTALYGANNTPNPVLGDFKSQYLMINRVSNLITTRSDSFTAYIVLQGWRNAETPGAQLAVQRRVAFLIDRSGVTPVNPAPTINFVPNQ